MKIFPLTKMKYFLLVSTVLGVAQGQAMHDVAKEEGITVKKPSIQYQDCGTKIKIYNFDSDNE